jgi:hypothetical protein
MLLTPTTELEAVNIMLATVGEAPINDLETSSTYDVAFAKRTLAEIDREVQSFGWRFNSDTKVTLPKDVSGFVAVPANALRVKLVQDSSIDPVIRGTTFYDRKNKTNVFTKDLTAERIVYRIQFNDLPETARHYITTRAARRFQTRVQGDKTASQYTMQDEIEARSILRKDQADTNHLTSKNAPGVFEVVYRQRRGLWR